MSKGKMYIIHPEGTAFGPFDWKFVRFLHGLGLISGYYVNEVGSQTVCFPEENSKMLNQPAWVNRYLSLPSDSGFTKGQINIFHLSGLPTLTSLGHRYTGRKIISLIEEEVIRAISPKLLWRAEKEAGLGWKTEPATDAQKLVISQNGICFKPEITKGEASCLIGNPATEAQYKRLAFYGLGYIQNITKAEASELIDDYKSSFKDSEIEYQKNKDQPQLACDDSATYSQNNHAKCIEIHGSIYIYKNNEQNGPFNQAEILEMLGNGTVIPSDLAWVEGISNWSPINSLFDLNIPISDQPRATENAEVEKQINTGDEKLTKEFLSNINSYCQILRDFLPDLELNIPQNFTEIKSYCHELKHAVDSYISFTIDELENEIFYDMGNGREYMFFFATPPTEDQLNQFKLLMLETYFKKGRSENFDHLAVVKKAFPGVKFERMDIF